MSPKLPKNPNEPVYFLENLYLPTLTEDEENFLRLCYHSSAREPRALEILTQYLDKGVNISVVAQYDVTALHLICLTNTKPNAIELVRLLLERGADPNLRSSNHATPLHILVWMNHTETLVPLATLLIQFGADVNARQENDENALHKLLRLNQTPYLLQVVRLLVENRIRINENGGLVKGFGSALHILCEANQTPLLLEVAKYLVESGILVNLRDDKNNTVLHLLGRYNQTEHLLSVVRFFVESGTDINAINDQGQTALHVLCQYNQSSYVFSVIEYLIEAGIQVSASSLTSVMSLICKYNQTSQLSNVMNLLIKHENASQTDCDGCQAAHLCAQYQKENLVQSLRILISNGEHLAAINSDSETILHLMCQYADQLNLVSVVASLGESLIKEMVDVTDSTGKTPLHHAARTGCIKTVQYLAQLSSLKVFDVFGKCYIDYLENFIQQKGTSLCTCCRNDHCLSLIDIKSLDQQKLIRRTTLLPCSISKIESSIPEHIDHVYVFNTFDRYTKITRGDNWIDLANAWHNYNTKFDFKKAVQAAGTGLGYCGPSCSINGNCTCSSLLLCVTDYIRSLTEEVKKIDERFATRRLIFYGSSSEQTKLFQLDEFDFLVVLSHFTEKEEKNGHVVYCGDGQANFLGHGDGRLDISSGRAIYYFYQLLRAATKRIDCFNIHMRDITFGETCTTLYMIYCGSGQILPISIDITIGIARSSSLDGTESSREHLSWCQVLRTEESLHSDEPTEYLVPFRDKCGPPEWRVSYPTLERDTLLRTGDRVRMCYRILKLLVMLCQRRKSSDSDQLIPQKTKPSTYTIKTCLFRYMEFNSPPWREQDVISHCIGILEVFITHPGVHLKSFFNPNLNVAYIDHEALGICREICDRLRSCLIPAK